VAELQDAKKRDEGLLKKTMQENDRLKKNKPAQTPSKQPPA
jgi:hypothetical protein